MLLSGDQVLRQSRKAEFCALPHQLVHGFSQRNNLQSAIESLYGSIR